MNEQIPEEAAQLPEFHFVGSDVGHDAHVAAADSLDSNAPDIYPAEEILPTREAKALLGDMGDAVWAYGKTLGLDLSKRLSFIDKNKVILLNKANMELFAQTRGKVTGWDGSTTPSKHIIARAPSSADPKWRQQADSLAHETVHAMGDHKWQLKWTGARSDLNLAITHAGTGIAPVSANGTRARFLMLNEVITEETNRRIQEKVWPHYHRLNKVMESAPAYEYRSYQPMVVAGHKIVDHAAEKLGRTSDELWDDLSRSLFTGDMKVLRQFNEVYGTEGVRALADWNEADINDTNDTLFKLGLPALVRIAA